MPNSYKSLCTKWKRYKYVDPKFNVHHALVWMYRYKKWPAIILAFNSHWGKSQMINKNEAEKSTVNRSSFISQSQARIIYSESLWRSEENNLLNTIISFYCIALPAIAAIRK